MKYHQDTVDVVLADFWFVENLHFPDFALLQMIHFQSLLSTLIDCIENEQNFAWVSSAEILTLSEYISTLSSFNSQKKAQLR